MTAHGFAAERWCAEDIAGGGLQIKAMLPAGTEICATDIPRNAKSEAQIFVLTEPQIICIASGRWVQFERPGWHEKQIERARIIAAAPDLFTSAQWLLTTLESVLAGRAVRDADEVIENAKLAIAAATGSRG